MVHPHVARCTKVIMSSVHYCHLQAYLQGERPPEMTETATSQEGGPGSWEKL